MTETARAILRALDFALAVDGKRIVAVEQKSRPSGWRSGQAAGVWSDQQTAPSLL